MEFTCDTCGAVFSTQKSLQRHVRAQHLGEIQLCVHCDRHYKYLSDKAKHEQDCTGKQIKCQQNICDFCGRIYRHKQGLNNHIQAQHMNITTRVQFVARHSNFQGIGLDMKRPFAKLKRNYTSALHAQQNAFH